MGRSVSGSKLKKERIITGGSGLKEGGIDLELHVLDLRVVGEEGGNVRGFSGRHSGMGSDQGESTVVRQEHGSKSEKWGQMAHSSDRKESYVRRVSSGA